LLRQPIELLEREDKTLNEQLEMMINLGSAPSVIFWEKWARSKSVEDAQSTESERHRT